VSRSKTKDLEEIPWSALCLYFFRDTIPRGIRASGGIGGKTRNAIGIEDDRKKLDRKYLIE
jgi:hypothetical protein